MGAPDNYVLDTNVYVEAYKRYYAFDIVPAFWDHLAAHGRSRRVVSIDRVKDEVEEKDDPLYAWVCAKCDEDVFVKTDRPDVIHYYAAIMNWVQRQNYKAGAVPEFARGADGWLIAYAKAAGHVVVTEETYDPDRRNKIKIPNVCKQFGVRYINTFDLLRTLGITFR